MKDYIKNLALTVLASLFLFSCNQTSTGISPTSATNNTTASTEETTKNISTAVINGDFDDIAEMDPEDFQAAYDELSGSSDQSDQFLASVLCLAKITELPTVQKISEVASIGFTEGTSSYGNAVNYDTSSTSDTLYTSGKKSNWLSAPSIAVPQNQMVYLNSLKEMNETVDLSELPEIHEVQEEIENSFFPIFDNALEKLEELANDPSFSFEITYNEPSYDYSDYENTVTNIAVTKEIDATEAAILLSVFQTLKIYLNYMVAWDFDIDQNGSYQVFEPLLDEENATASDAEAIYSHLLGFLTPSSSFLSLRSGKASLLEENLDLVKKNCNAAILAINNLKNESDDQSDDLIPNSEITTADFAAAAAIAEKVKSFLTGAQTLTLGSQTVSIDLRHFSDIRNIRDFLPYYHLDADNLVQCSQVTDEYGSSTSCDINPDAYYLTDASGGKTIGSDEDIDDYLDDDDIGSWGNYIVWKDPTFNGILPGMTNSGFWSLLAYLADYENEDAIESSLSNQFAEIISLIEAADESHRTSSSYDDYSYKTTLLINKLGTVAATALTDIAGR